MATSPVHVLVREGSSDDNANLLMISSAPHDMRVDEAGFSYRTGYSLYLATYETTKGAANGSVSNAASSTYPPQNYASKSARMCP